MSFLGNVMRSVVNPATIAQLAMGPAGWASIALKAVVSAVAQQVIQEIGQKLGLPASVVNAAQQAFSQASGLGSGIPGISASGVDVRALANHLGTQGMNFTDAASFARDIASQVQKAKTTELKQSVQDFIDNINQGNENKKLEKDIAGVWSGKGSLLMKLAIAMGKLADKKMNDMADTAQKMGKFGEVSGKNQGQYAELNGKMQALGQEFSLISNALTNVIKSLGEGASTIARK